MNRCAVGDLVSAEVLERLRSRDVLADDLLAALKNLLARVDRQLPNGLTPYGHNCHWCQTCYYRAEDEARAAIAKAEKGERGEQMEGTR